MRAVAPALLATLTLATAQPAAAAASLIVHEWGTFTSFQDSRGRTIPGINVDDEPVPQFVHRLREAQIFTTRSTPASWSQGAPRCHPEVTLRLETPVLYFYPQSGFALNQLIDVRASFTNGWLTEFFPAADASNPGFPQDLRQSVRGSIEWKGLRLSRESSAGLPDTTEHVWLAPRNVKSAVVINAAEAEKYLFYRGVGHLDAPIVVREEGDSLSIALRNEEKLLTALPRMWIVHVSADKQLTYRSIEPGNQRTLSARLPTAHAAQSALDALRLELRAALQTEGLYADEADAMLATWRLSYFDSEGMRVFFVLPRSWTEAQLPLSISAPAEVTRVMLGRVELISAHQEAALKRLYELPATAFDVPPLYYQDKSVLELMRGGARSHAELYRAVGRPVPDALGLYESLGRFRDALLAHEMRSASDAERKARLMLIMERFSACVSGGTG
ncbi:MAG TPA: hypothetical protein VFO35_21515 [Steroidobacteraceae bacterium]|nr:hypothetical protein [Steroidobacteraceae bacterium]